MARDRPVMAQTATVTCVPSGILSVLASLWYPYPTFPVTHVVVERWTGKDSWLHLVPNRKKEGSGGDWRDLGAEEFKQESKGTETAQFLSALS